MLPALDTMKEYLGLLFSFPDMVDVHRGAVAKVRECEKMKEECRIDVSQAFCLFQPKRVDFDLPC